jgi:hypothetical protein
LERGLYFVDYREAVAFSLALEKERIHMPSSIFEKFPEIDDILEQSNKYSFQIPVTSNIHIHSPYSFSAFADIHEAVSLAQKQDVLALGISDFNTAKGYDEFTRECVKAGIFPGYCMETIALSMADQRSGIRWNDPGNPGRIYFCGKGLKYPLQLSDHAHKLLSQLTQALDKRIRRMIDKLNDHLKDTLPDIQLDYEHIRDTITRGTVRERHLAKALQQAILEKFPGLDEKKQALEKLYGAPSKINVADEVAIQNELRTNLLKSGKVAFVEESPEAFPDLNGAKSLVTDMSGIPCYPVLADGTKGELTEMERDPDSLSDELLKRDIYCAEFIPSRNNITLVREYASVFSKKGIILTAGTEHNTPLMEPMIPRCSGGVDLDDELKRIFWQGACAVAAHQYLSVKGQAGYVDKSGNRTTREVKELESIGSSVILYYLANFKQRGK